MKVDPEAWSSAEPYEPFMGRWSRILAAEVLAWIDPDSGQRWLDVGCGTGAVSEAVLAVADPLSLMGIDPSAAYLAAAAARLNDPRMMFRVGEAALPLPERVDALDSDLVELARRHDQGAKSTVMDWEYLLFTAQKKS